MIPLYRSRSPVGEADGANASTQGELSENYVRRDCACYIRFVKHYLNRFKNIIRGLLLSSAKMDYEQNRANHTPTQIRHCQRSRGLRFATFSSRTLNPSVDEWREVRIVACLQFRALPIIAGDGVAARGRPAVARLLESPA